MGFIKFLFQLAFWAFMIVVGFMTLMFALDSSNPYIALTAGIIAFIVGVGIIGWKFWLALFGLYKVKEFVTEEPEPKPEPEVVKKTPVYGLRMTPSEKEEKLRRIDELQEQLNAMRRELKK